MNESLNRELCEKTLSCEECYRGMLVSVDHVKVSLPNGKIGLREIVRKGGAAAVVPVDAQGNVYMVRQYRAAFEKIMLEIPAGKLDSEQENPRDAAARELEEETGLQAAKLEKLTDLVVSPGFCTESVSLFLATELSQHQMHLDADEFLHVEKYPLSEMVNRVMNGEISDAKTVAGLLMAWQRLQNAHK